MKSLMTRGARAGQEDRLLTLPNLLSGLRLASVPVFLWLFISGRETAGVLLYAVGAASDFVDGYVARATGSVTKLGKVLDPLADRVLIVALVVALVVRDALPWGLAAAIVARDVVVVTAFALLERRGVKRLEVNTAGKAATACLLFGLTWLAASFVWKALGEPVGVGFVWVGAVLYWVAGALYARDARGALQELANKDAQ